MLKIILLEIVQTNLKMSKKRKTDDSKDLFRVREVREEHWKDSSELVETLQLKTAKETKQQVISKLSPQVFTHSVLPYCGFVNEQLLKRVGSEFKNRLIIPIGDLRHHVSIEATTLENGQKMGIVKRILTPLASSISRLFFHAKYLFVSSDDENVFSRNSPTALRHVFDLTVNRLLFAGAKLTHFTLHYDEQKSRHETFQQVGWQEQDLDMNLVRAMTSAVLKRASQSLTEFKFVYNLKGRTEFLVNKPLEGVKAVLPKLQLLHYNGPYPLISEGLIPEFNVNLFKNLLGGGRVHHLEIDYFPFTPETLFTVLQLCSPDLEHLRLNKCIILRIGMQGSLAGNLTKRSWDKLKHFAMTFDSHEPWKEFEWFNAKDLLSLASSKQLQTFEVDAHVFDNIQDNEWKAFLQPLQTLQVFRVLPNKYWQGTPGVVDELVHSCPFLTQVRLPNLKLSILNILTEKLKWLENFPCQKRSTVELKTVELLNQDAKNRHLLRFKLNKVSQPINANQLEQLFKQLSTLEQIWLGKHLTCSNVFHPVQLLHKHLTHLVLPHACELTNADFDTINRHFQSFSKDQFKLLRLGIPPIQVDSKEFSKDAKQPENRTLTVEHLTNMVPNTDYRLWNCVFEDLKTVQQVQALSRKCLDEKISLGARVTFALANKLSAAYHGKRQLFTDRWVVCPRKISTRYKMWHLLGDFAMEVSQELGEFGVAIEHDIVSKEHRKQLLDLYVYSEPNLDLENYADDTFYDYEHVKTMHKKWA